jgi:hypothetical protein
VEDDPTSTTVRDRALGPTQCGISDVATKCTKGGRKPNICRCMLGAVLSWRCLGRHRLRCQPCSRIGENPPYGMIGGIEETSASSKPDPRLDPTRLRGALSNERPYRDLRNVVAKYPFERSHRFPGPSRLLATKTIRVGAKVRARLIVIELASEMLLRSQRKVHWPWLPPSGAAGRAGLSSARARQSIDSAAHQPPFRRRKRRRGVAAIGAK